MHSLTAVGLVGVLLAFSPAPGEPETRKPGVVIVVGGIGGVDPVAAAARWALPRAGVAHPIDEFVWTHGVGRFFRDLQDHEHMAEKAGELAERVCRLKAARPDCPIYLIGRSGGAGVVLGAAQQVPPQTLERIILLSPAVAPDHDLRPAFRATRGEIISFNSLFDWFVLGWGTRTFGTADRIYVPSAGFSGFVPPDGFTAADRLLYERRLVQVPWSPRLIWRGQWGGHVGTALPWFLTAEVAPWLKP